LQYVEKIDEPREPISGAAAFVNVIIAGVLIYGIWSWV
ncbi:hypothetical protein LCGC14_2674060, partial [marine sediment metagenome]